MTRIALAVALALGSQACINPVQDASHGQLSNADVARTAVIAGVVVGGIALFVLAAGDKHDDYPRPLSSTSPQPFER